MPTLSRFMAHDADIISYTIGGRKYVGWPEFEHDMQEEFSSVVKLEIPIHELKVWTKGTLAWFTMELDYIRYCGRGTAVNGERCFLSGKAVSWNSAEGQWVLLSWHESLRNMQLARSFGPTSHDTFPATLGQQCSTFVNAGLERGMGNSRG